MPLPGRYGPPPMPPPEPSPMPEPSPLPSPVPVPVPAPPPLPGPRLSDCAGAGSRMTPAWSLILAATDRKSVVEGKRVDLGGRRIIKKKKKKERYGKKHVTETKKG